ncbi:MAG: FIST N-terminal domain-containing protein, partial [Verrucomicrobiota bacterium]
MSAPLQNLSASCLVASPYDEGVVRKAARACHEQLGADPDLVLAFVSSDYQKSVSSFLESIQIDGRASTIIGGSASGLIGTGAEIENTSGFSLLFLKMPSTRIKILEKLPAKGITAPTLLLTNASSDTLDSLLETWNHDSTPHPLIGCGITGGPEEEDLFLFSQEGLIDGDTLCLELKNGIQVVPLLAHGCRPIGEPVIVTRANESEVLELARQEPFDVLEEAFEALGTELQVEADGHIFAGLAIDEETEDFGSADFQIRQIVGATLEDGRLRLESPVRPGQTLQFLWRDPLAAEMELRVACEDIKKMHGSPFAATLFAGKGRDKALFGVENRNISIFEDTFAQLPLAGMHSFGEFGAASP